MKIILLSLAMVILAPQIYAENLKAPDFAMADANDAVIIFPRIHDGVDIYLFWAGWCPYCKALFLVDGEGAIRFSLYDMIFNDSAEFKAMSHGKKAGYRAPNWAAEIRIKIDQILAEGKVD